MPNFDPAWFTLGGLLFGGVGVKFIEHWLSRRVRRDDATARMREELRTDLKATKEELAVVEDELDLWKSKYYQILTMAISQGVTIEWQSLKVDGNN